MAVLTFKHNGTSLDELVVGFMCAVDVFAVCHPRSYTLWCAAKIQSIVNLCVLVGTIETE
jgi:hypothetical protein